eukprot:112404_1
MGCIEDTPQEDHVYVYNNEEIDVENTPKIATKDAGEHDNQNDKIMILVHVTDWTGKYEDNVLVTALYQSKETLQNLFNTTIQYMENKYNPLKFSEPFLLKDGFPESITSANSPITRYSKRKVLNKGLRFRLNAYYEHQITNKSIDCPQMMQQNTSDPSKCDIYSRMIGNADIDCTAENLNHLYEYNHFKDDIINKPKCEHGDECKAFIRTEKGESNVNDECHLKLYLHPPRSRKIELQQNIHSFVMQNERKECSKVYKPTREESNKYNEGVSISAQALIDEVIKNGFKTDLCLLCSTDDDCKHTEFGIMNVVDEKLNCRKLKIMDVRLKRGEMLSLILYTGGQCNYDLCASQRNGDYDKWKWFDYFLFSAIRKLSKWEKGFFPVYTGMNAVNLDQKQTIGYFQTYVSTSWHMEVALCFIKGNGMLIRLDSGFKNGDSISNVHCCDVSWVSKFPDEAEILFARSVNSYGNLTSSKFSMKVVDRVGDTQVASLAALDKLEDYGDYGKEDLGWS